MQFNVHIIHVYLKRVKDIFVFNKSLELTERGAIYSTLPQNRMFIRTQKLELEWTKSYCYGKIGLTKMFLHELVGKNFTVKF